MLRRWAVSGEKTEHNEGGIQAEKRGRRATNRNSCVSGLEARPLVERHIFQVILFDPGPLSTVESTRREDRQPQRRQNLQ